jgi:Tfp pilus assembly protein PilN
VIQRQGHYRWSPGKENNMKFKTRTTIEITERFIKVMQALAGDRHALTFTEVIPIDNLNDEGIVQKLMALHKVKGFNLRGSQIILIIPRQHIILRYLSLPAEDRLELKTMVDLQAVNHIPYNKDEVVIDFLPFDKNNLGYTKVLVVVAPEDIVMRFWKILQAAHMTAHKVTLSSTGLWQWHRSRQLVGKYGVVGLIDIDIQNSEICICDQYRFLTSRHTSLGIKELEDQKFNEFAKQLEWTIVSYTKEKLGPPISQILILSSLDNATGLKEELEKSFSIPVQLVRTPQDVPLHKSFTWSPSLLQDGPSITAALGLLQSDHKIAIDLLPREIREIRSHLEKRQQWIRFGVVTFLMLLVVGIALSLDYFKQSTYLKDLQDQVKTTKKDAQAVEKQAQQVTVLKSLINRRIVMADVIDEIYKILPKSISLVNLTLTQDHSLSLQGFSTKGGDINDMQKAFVDSAYFENVNLDYVNKRITQDGEVNYFKITCQIKFSGIGDEKT